MSSPDVGLVIRSLKFTGPNATPAALTFEPGSNLLYGASNTGKSFTVKAIEFMLTGAKRIPEIEERQGYDRLWLALNLPGGDEVTLVRALAAGSFELYAGFVSALDAATNPRQLSAKHDHTNSNNVSQFLIERLNFGPTFIATDASGNKRSLNMHDLARFCIVDETTIQSETSPLETGQHSARPAERSAFKLLITGIDDGAIVAVLAPKEFKTARAAKIEVIDEMLGKVHSELAAGFPEADDLQEQNNRLEKTLVSVQHEVQLAQESLKTYFSAKSKLAEEISRRRLRRGEITINLRRFDQLQEVYRSDVERLEALEEAGFLLLLGGDKPCPLCGAAPAAQHHSHGLEEVAKTREAAIVEMGKIKQQSSELDMTIKQLRTEAGEVDATLSELERELDNVEGALTRLTSSVEEANRHLNQVLSARDRVRDGLQLIDQQNALTIRRRELEAKKATSKADKPVLGVTGTVAHEFAQTVKHVLEEWRFPGPLHVSFDESSYDLRINGKHRRDNGKGVRAITHAAFKVGLLLFCRQRQLPHPGFLVLDTPLLTYRDPMKSKEGPLSPDEEEIKKTSLKTFFFEHLASISNLGQFIIVENVDPPPNIDRLARTQAFTGDPATGRAGLFPPHV